MAFTLSARRDAAAPGALTLRCAKSPTAGFALVGLATDCGAAILGCATRAVLALALAPGVLARSAGAAFLATCGAPPLVWAAVLATCCVLGPTCRVGSGVGDLRPGETRPLDVRPATAAAAACGDGFCRLGVDDARAATCSTGFAAGCLVGSWARSVLRVTLRTVDDSGFADARARFDVDFDGSATVGFAGATLARSLVALVVCRVTAVAAGALTVGFDERTTWDFCGSTGLALLGSALAIAFLAGSVVGRVGVVTFCGASMRRSIAVTAGFTTTRGSGLVTCRWASVAFSRRATLDVVGCGCLGVFGASAATCGVVTCWTLVCD